MPGRAVPCASAPRGLLVDFSSSAGGIGVSTTAACFARTARDAGLSCALLDMDFAGGGLDVTLGLEDAPGLRWSQVEAPLGVVDGPALLREATDWGGIPMISADPWNRGVPPWWEMAAVLDALTGSADVVVVDSGPLGLATCMTLGGMGSFPIPDGSAGPAAHELEPYSASRRVPPPPPTPTPHTPAPPPAPPRAPAGNWLSDPRLSDTQLSGTRSVSVHGQGARPDPFAPAAPAPPAILPDSIPLASVHLVELSVLGLVRARMHRANEESSRQVCATQEGHPLAAGFAEAAQDAAAGRNVVAPLFIAAEPASPRHRHVISVSEAGDYLSANVLGPLSRDRRLCSAILAGAGIATVPRSLRRTMDDIAVALGLAES